MKKYEGPITQENFNDVWEYGNNKLIEIKKKLIVEKIVYWVGNLLFLFMLLLVTYGALHQFKEPSFQEYLADSKVFAACWSVLKPIVYHPQMHWVAQFIINIIPAFVVSIAVSFGAYAAFMYFYKPAIKEMSNNLEEDSLEFYRITKEIVFRKRKPSVAVSISCNIIYLVVLLLYITTYIVQLVGDKNSEAIAALIVPIMENMGWLFQNQEFITFIGIIVISIYGVLNTLLGHILKLMYTVKLPESLAIDAESFFYECNPDEKARIEEEDRIISLANEIKDRRRKEKIEFEQGLDAKVKELIKKVKAGSIIAVVLVLVFFGAWLSANLDINHIMETFSSYTIAGNTITAEPVTQEYEFDDQYTHTAYYDDVNGYRFKCTTPVDGVMNKILFKTTDGGGTFEAIADISALPNEPCGIHFFTDQIGYIILRNQEGDNFLYRTEDGGNSWFPQKLEIPVAEYTHVNGSYIDSDGLVIEVISGDVVTTYTYVTYNMGNTWDLLITEEIGE